ncbi:MAG: hypothetical protein LBU94_05190 [Clostridiales bacterium]|jgi:transcription initiation factor TFIIIB Brf1 subunit/transcription initiation factor TFIIB|nr:hypothetical protein [Clostridiales bacterium]
MKCKNCNTDINDGDNVCKNCGEPVETKAADNGDIDAVDMEEPKEEEPKVNEDNDRVITDVVNSDNNNYKGGGSLKYILIALAAIVIVLALVFMNDNNKTTGQPSQSSETPVENTEENTATPNEPVESPEGTITEDPETAEPAETAEVTETEAPTPSSDANLEMSMEDVWTMIDNVNENMAMFYEKYSPTVAYISKNGYLYDSPAENYVFIDELSDLTEVDEEYLDESLMFFFLRPADLSGFGDLRLSDSQELKIFTGYETKDGFAIAADKEQGGVISREDLKSVLDSYSWEHGDVRRIPFQTNEFESVIRELSAYNNEDEGFDVRFMERDDKYISVVASPKGEPDMLRQYILEDTGDILVVRMDSIESYPNYRVEINKVLPDFNQDLLPDYNLNTVMKYIQTDFQMVVDAMLEGGLITEDDLPVVFSTGTDDFSYIEFESGSRFVGHMEENNSWKMYPVEDYDTAVTLMDSLDKNAPMYILKQY